MTKFLGWMTPCGARVLKCDELRDGTRRVYACCFDKNPMANDGTGELLFKDWTFLENGNHCIGFIDPLLPPGDPIDAAGSYTFNGEPVTILTTGAAGYAPVIVQTRSGELKRFSSWGSSSEGKLENAQPH